MTHRQVGTLCIVLHTHLPWVAGHGAWPVGEEWLHQAWSGSYLPVVESLHRLGAQGRRDVLSLGVTPVLAAQLDDPYCLREHHEWLGRWQLRAQELAARPGRHLRDLAAAEFRSAGQAIETFERRWRHGGSAALRPLADAGVVELLGGPATHPVLPLLPPPVARLAVRSGLDDAAVRVGRRPGGIWVPECAVSPDLPRLLAAEGVRHVMVDESTLRRAGGGTDRAWAADGVAVLGRDLALTDEVWSARTGYPAHGDYRDFHAVDDRSGLRLSRVTDASAPGKAPYDPAAGAARARRDAEAFVDATRRRLRARSARGEQPLAVVAWDTELFGHWWHEGPVFLEQVLRLLPDAGVVPASLGTVAAGAAVGPRELRLPVGSWGSGKDLRLWSGPAVADLARDGQDVAARLLQVALGRGGRTSRDPALDGLAREALLALSSDWAFMVSRDSAAGYARGRHDGHVRRFHRLADGLLGTLGTLGAPSRPDEPPGPRTNMVVPHLDARYLGRATGAPRTATRMVTGAPDASRA